MPKDTLLYEKKDRYQRRLTNTSISARANTLTWDTSYQELAMLNEFRSLLAFENTTFKQEGSKGNNLLQQRVYTLQTVNNGLLLANFILNIFNTYFFNKEKKIKKHVAREKMQLSNITEKGATYSPQDFPFFNRTLENPGHYNSDMPKIIPVLGLLR